MVLSKEDIKALALNAGFKVKVQPDESIDLNPYVYRFAEDLLRRSPWRSGIGTSEGCVERISQGASGGIVRFWAVKPDGDCQAEIAQEAPIRTHPEVSIQVTTPQPEKKLGPTIPNFWVIPGVAKSEDLPEFESPEARAVRLAVMVKQLQERNRELEGQLNSIVSKLLTLADEQERL